MDDLCTNNLKSRESLMLRMRSAVIVSTEIRFYVNGFLERFNFNKKIVIKELSLSGALLYL